MRRYSNQCDYLFSLF